MNRAQHRAAGERLLSLLDSAGALECLNYYVVREARALLVARLVDIGAGAAELREALALATLQAARNAIRRAQLGRPEISVEPLSSGPPE